MESEHIRPLWISTTATSQVHKVNVEVDTGADCNVIPVYLFSKNLWKQTARVQRCQNASLWRDASDDSW